MLIENVEQIEWSRLRKLPPVCSVCQNPLQSFPVIQAAQPNTWYHPECATQLAHDLMADVSKGGSMEITDEQAIRCAVDQVTLDMPYVEVEDAAIFRKIVNEDQKLMRNDAQTGTTGDRWYVEVTLRHFEDESTAMALYRVWHSVEGLKAIRVTMA